MTDLSYDPLDRIRFPVDEWRLVELDPDDGDLGHTESMFAVGNGYLGMRGNSEEGRPSSSRGTYINGFHETWPIRHAEQAYGFARTGQTIVNVPDAKLIKVFVDDEPLTLSLSDLPEYERSLDFRDGVLRRHLVWRTPSGKRVRVDSTRLVSFTDRHLALMTMEITMLDVAAPVVVSSQIVNRTSDQDDYSGHRETAHAVFDPRRGAASVERVLEPEKHWNSERRMILGYRCRNSGMTLAVAADHTCVTDNPWEQLISAEPDIGKKVYRVHAKVGVPIRITKAVTYHTSRGVPVVELFDRCRRTLDRVRDNGHEHYQEIQRTWLDAFWRNSDVQITGQPAVQQAVRWCLFQLAQAAGRADQHGIPAKGLTGSGYEGHYFWDSDIYVVPFLTYTNPWMARNALRSRANIVPIARRRARELNQNGILFPWRTINGEEASAYYAAGTAQYHIDADVVYAFAKYADATGDVDFLHRVGGEVFAETARMWADLGFWRDTPERPREFHIHGVTGPDEYTAVVNNNLFTNVMARYNLRRAAALMREMKATESRAYAQLVKRIKLTEDEVEEWERCADGMVIPFDEHLKIHPQDEYFLHLEMWDLAATPEDMRPLLLHFHPLVIYRYQVLKQTDVVLALFLQGDQFTPQEKRADFDYYDPLTTGDSSLSASTQAVMAAEVGYRALALKYFHASLFVDLADLHRNANDGLHVASMGGVWTALVQGFAGMRDHHGHITFDPRLPANWESLAFPLRVRGARVRVRLNRDEIGFMVDKGETATVSVRGESFDLVHGDEIVVRLAGQGPNLRPRRIGAVGGLRSDGSVITANTPNLEASWDLQEVMD